MKALHRIRQAAILGVLLLPALSATAQDNPNLVSDIQIVGNEHYTPHAILADVKTRIGQPYDEAVARDDQERLMKTGKFESVKVTRRPTPQGVVVVIEVVERPTIDNVQFEGNKSVPAGQLLSALSFGPGGPMNLFAIETGRQAIISKYHSEGFPDVAVTVDEETLQKERRLVYRITEGPQVTVGSIKFKGNHHYNWIELRLKIGSTTKFWPFTTGAINPEQVEKDVDTIRNLYMAEGFLDVKVGREYQYSQGGTRATLVFLIDEGPRFHIGKIAFRGNEVFSDQQLMTRLNLTGGKYFTALGLSRDAKKLQDAYGELGYIAASVTADRSFREEPGVVDLQYTIVEDDKYNVGQIVIRGNSVTESRVIRREVHVYPEQPYNTVALDEAKQRLQDLRLFKSVDMKPIGSEEASRDVLVQVEEDQTAQFIAGAGISSNDGLIGNLTLRQRNFDILRPGSFNEALAGRAWKGAGQTLTISAEPGTELMSFYVDWFEPALRDGPYTLGGRGFLWTRGRETYDETRYGAVASVGRHLPNQWYAELADTPQMVDINNLDHDAPRDVRDVEGTHFLNGIKGSLTRDRTDSRFMPSTGDRLSLSYEEVVGDFNFGRAIGDYRAYQTLYVDPLDRKHVLAERFGIGDIITEAPTFERFYGGGTGSIRGFKYRGISPQQEGEPVGGNFELFLGSEYSFPVVGEMLRGVLFVDTGTVEEHAEVKHYRSSAGFGLRWVIPFLGPVPMDFDFGFPITKAHGDDTQIFSFNIGVTF